MIIEGDLGGKRMKRRQRGEGGSYHLCFVMDYQHVIVKGDLGGEGLKGRKKGGRVNDMTKHVFFRTSSRRGRCPKTIRERDKYKH